MNAHWCAGKLSSIKIQSLTEKGSCACGESKLPKPCCKDTHTVIKLTDSQKTVSQLTISKSDAGIEVFGFSPSIQLTSFPGINILAFQNYKSWPFNGKQPVYLNNCVFRI